ncbi:MAG TPA: hypothetical protein VJB66_02255 [Candidatus Nanoarchaeia archaeon]|nr:hypothetical protein [Candidatus Nanoarchaeia archaeon]
MRIQLTEPANVDSTSVAFRYDGLKISAADIRPIHDAVTALVSEQLDDSLPIAARVLRYDAAEDRIMPGVYGTIRSNERGLAHVEIRLSKDLPINPDRTPDVEKGIELILRKYHLSHVTMAEAPKPEPVYS